MKALLEIVDFEVNDVITNSPNTGTGTGGDTNDGTGTNVPPPF